MFLNYYLPLPTGHPEYLVDSIFWYHLIEVFRHRVKAYISPESHALPIYSYDTVHILG